jgi:hypothetical protein
VSELDPLGRTPLAEGMKRMIADALKDLPPDAKAALLVVGDTQTKTVRAHFVANLPGEGWRVAAGPGFNYESKKFDGWVAVEKVWK